jgi:hypothetical protein
MSIVLVGSTSGSITLQEPAVAGTTVLSLPSTTGNVVVDSATQTLTNKTIQGGQWTSPSGSTITSGTAVASTSGTSIDFTGIPNWVKRVTVMFSGVSTSGTSNWLVRVGSGSFQATGYTSTASYMTTTPATASDTTGFIWRSDNAGNNISGAMIMYNITGNTWVENLSGGGNNNNQSYVGGGSVSLSGALDRIRITTVNGSDTFDAGSINILYE